MNQKTEPAKPLHHLTKDEHKVVWESIIADMIEECYDRPNKDLTFQRYQNRRNNSDKKELTVRL